MMTTEQEVVDALDELREVSVRYRAASAFWLKERRQIIDICLAHGDWQTVEAILRHFEKSCAWSRWPLTPSPSPTARVPPR